MMGSEHGETDEVPVHQVTISRGFYMGKHEVTQAQWEAVMGANPARFQNCSSCPVEQVSFTDAQEFIGKLNRQEIRERSPAAEISFRYRLPSEAEWEYAARAGTTTTFAFGDSLSAMQANFNGNQPYGGATKGVYRGKTTPVGSFQPNAFGLFDMHGNVWEWCQDWSHLNYEGAPTDQVRWGSEYSDGQHMVIRGGSWLLSASNCRSSVRGRRTADDRMADCGFRVVADVGGVRRVRSNPAPD